MRVTEIMQPLEIVEPRNHAAVLLDVHDVDQIGGGEKHLRKKQTPAARAAGIVVGRARLCPTSGPSP
jgi:hypothetical protein